MRLFELILQDVRPQRIAKEAVQEVANNADLSMSVKHFLHSVMDAIGFQYYVTINEVTSQVYQWPMQEASQYVFNLEPSLFDKYTIFLEEFCKTMKQKNLLDPLVEILEHFWNLCNCMDATWEKNFDEPFSLISYSLLKSMHKIRKTTKDNFMLWDHVCHKLFENAQKGLGFPDSHEIVMNGLCVLLEKDFDYFSYFNGNIFDFYKKCFEYEYYGSKGPVFRHLDDVAVITYLFYFIFKYYGSKGPVFRHMKNAVNNSRVSSSSKIFLVEHLAGSEMIHSYCVFAQHSSNTLVISLLKFLNSLLSHLTVLECFSRAQLHVIFGNALKADEQIRSLAVQFYTSFMQRNCREKFIFRDILEYFSTKANDIKLLDDFVESLWERFPYMTHFKSYIRIFMKYKDKDLQILCITAQFCFSIFKKMNKECENNDEYALRLSKFLVKLPSILCLLEDKYQVRGILLQVYPLVNLEVGIVTIKDLPIAAAHFVQHALRSLAYKGEDYSIVHNTCQSMLMYMDFFEMQEEMEHFANSVYETYQVLTQNTEQFTGNQVNELQHTLILLSCITDTFLALRESSVFELSVGLRALLVDSKTFYDLSLNHNTHLESLAITTYSGCLKILYAICAHISPDGSSTESDVLLDQVNAFLSYLSERLSDANQSNEDIFFGEAAIRAICDVYIVFKIKLERDTYNVMVHSVNRFVFGAPLIANQLRQCELQRNILRSINLFHKLVEIPSAITWKIVIHYGLAPNFNEEMNHLMDILFDYNSERFKKPSLFTSIVPAAIFNLFQRQIPYHKFRKALKAHKTYIESKMPDKTQRAMKVHIVLSLIDMIETAIKAGGINQPKNRIELLTNMNIFLTDAYQTRNLILRQSRRLEVQTLTEGERRTLSTFQERLSE